MKKLKDTQTDKKLKSSKQKEHLDSIVNRLYKMRVYSRVFRVLDKNARNKSFKRYKNEMLVNYMLNKKRKVMFNAWKNVTNILKKGRIKLKYAKLFQDRSVEIQNTYASEINRLRDILGRLELDIKQEMDERRNLSKLYDMNMNKGVEVFIKETNSLGDLNSSSNI